MLFSVRHPVFRLLPTLPCLIALVVGYGLHHHNIAEQIAVWCGAGGHHCCQHVHAPADNQQPRAPEHDPNDCEVCRFYAHAKAVSLPICAVREAPFYASRPNRAVQLHTLGVLGTTASPRGPPAAI